MTSYADFLSRKVLEAPLRGLDDIPALHPKLFPHQRDVTEFALRMGSAAAFVDTGLGKTLIELEYARACAEHTGKPSLILTPLAVAGQMKREADTFGIRAKVIRSQGDASSEVCICNYERLESLEPKAFGAVVLDESSILKGFSGKTRWALTRAFEGHRFRLAATATPAPNDHTELGTHAHFLGIMETQEMFARWFVHDSGRTQDWRLKGHAVGSFWSWVASWGRCVSMPSDLGYSDDGFVLPPLNYISHQVDVDLMQGQDEGHLFRMPGASATEVHKEKRLTVDERAATVGEIVRSDDKAWIVWCDTDYEADAIRKMLPAGEFLEVRGSMPLETKETNLQAFSDGSTRILLSKPSICGFGLNWQHCCRQVFAGLSFSYESLYQAVRRSWRFGQKNPVDVHVILSPAEQHAWSIVLKKSARHEEMKSEMRAAMKRAQNPQQRRRLGYVAGHQARRPAFLQEGVCG
jgi:hypothetical protein